MTATATDNRPGPPPFAPGDPVPWFNLPSNVNADFKFHSVAGRFVVLCFFGSGGDPAARERHDAILKYRKLFDDERMLFFGVSTDAQDREQKRFPDQIPGIRYFWDLDGAVSRQFRPGDGMGTTYVLDPTLRVIAAVRFDDTRGHDQIVDQVLRALPQVARHAGVELNAPVLIVPRVFELALCRKLIETYNAGQPQDSGFMREKDGKTVAQLDHTFKRRSDVRVEDRDLRQALMLRVHRRLVPEIFKAYQFKVTRMERYLIACYDATTGGYFKAHRDNTTKGTAHRRFAVTMNLNAEEYEGGDLRLPEFGPRSYRAPTGGAVVFSCSLLHEALPVTKGKRYAFLPFLYDDEAAKVREQNSAFLGEGLSPYRMDPKKT